MRIRPGAPSMLDIMNIRRSLHESSLPDLVKRQTLTPAERVYGRCYGLPVIQRVDWGNGTTDEGFDDRIPVLREIAFDTANLVREDRTRVHPVEYKLEEAFAELGIPVETQGLVLGELDHFDTSNSWNQFSEDSRLYITYFHLIRVGLRALGIANFLGLTDEMRRDLFVAGTLHDIGKSSVFRPKNHDKTFLEYRNQMEEHPTRSVEYLLRNRDIVGEEVLRIIERHHIFQTRPYPTEFITSETERSRYLTQIFTVADFDDSAATRANNRNAVSFLTRLFRKDLPSYGHVRALMLEDKGEIPITYEGSKHRTVGELIEDLYDRRVLGRGDRFNPDVYGLSVSKRVVA